ncbi:MULTISPECIES: hypothetical protein [Burkholderia]|uniref:hypothetical protein n=1 Tax=Burkholderia TaxID=32008 RepID=UPI00075D4252|nr:MULTISPECIES: hypothetical protein [Burkholderia]AOJ72263.1 hypothetical protein WS78_26410 [Burkholderia savannae]KVG44248.1 hypothetical protein WS77_09970 [Burkholderia sp. MSMB0265]KVG87776.1 hypothetical protein WS81_25955 [Burkholderia sp. MSMB2040]KVG96381.1 hypothetical protein WS83_03200 [Burkholderia sp. MSMB2042]KVG97177.1 hypothetical protein WS82_30180 [Burkholderia sp. MSMB2041]
MSIMYLSRFSVTRDDMIVAGPYRSKGAGTAYLNRMKRRIDVATKLSERHGRTPPESIDFSRYRIVEVRFVYDRTIEHTPKVK